MKQTINKKQQSSMQPVVRHASLFGVLMLSSTTLLPGVTALAAQTTDDTQNIPVTHPENTNDNQTNTPPFTLSNLDASSEWTEGELPLYLSLELTAHKQEELDTIVQLSPNVSIVDDATKVQINDETGRQIGVYVVDKELNQLHLTITEAGFTKAKLVVPIVFKSVTLGEQTVAVSIGDSILNKTILITQQEEVVGDEENDTSEVEETTEDVSTEITDQVEEVDDTSEDDSDSQEDMIVEETDQTDVEEATTSDTATKDEVDSSTVVEVEASKEETEQVESSSSESTSDSKESSEETESTETSETTESSSKEESEETDVSEESISQEEESTEVSESTDSSEEVTIESSEELAKTESKSSQEAQPRATKQVTAPAAFFSAPVGPMMARAATPQAQFIEETAYHAQGVAAQNDLYASVMIAQAILESGYGTSTLSSAPNYNLFGIKGNYNGQSVTMATQEFYNGQYVTINDQFRKYPSYKESFEDNANVLKTTSFSPGNYFYAGAWKSRTNSYRDATAWLTGRYATDPNYNTKLNSLIETHNLTQYDAPGGGQTSKPDNKPVNKPANKPNNNNKPTNTKPDKNAATYTVKKGDTLYGIGLQYNVSVAQLKSWNNLTSDIIYIGQKLIVKGEATNQKPAKPAPKPEKPVTTPVNKPNQSKPAQPKPNQPKPEINTTTYMVKKGDTLYGIGLTYGVSVAQLKSWNNLTGDMIYVGQKLVIKGGSSQGSTTKPNNNKPVSKPVNNKPTQPSQNHQQSKPSVTYTVKKGDTLYGIGLQYNVSVAQLKSWNNLTGDIIYIGQKLVVKGGNTQTPVSKPTNTKPVSQPVSKPVNNKPTQPANSSNQTTYKVRRGDTLYGIGLRYNVSINDIKRWNNLTSDIIYVDQVLNIGNQQTVALKPVSQKPVAKPVSTKPMNTLQYTVKSGDTLYSIALNNQTTVGAIQEANNLSGTLIFVGQTLKVPTNQQVAKPTRQGTRHKVVKGDTLWSLSQRYQASIGQLKQWNNIPGDIIYIGQNIQVS